LAAQTYEELFDIAETLRKNRTSSRPKISSLLKSQTPRFQHSSDLEINRSINLAIRLGLMINVQEATFGGLRLQATCVEWDDVTTLQDFVESIFAKSRWEITARSSRLGPHFTAAFMHRVCGLKFEWTTSLHDHLRLDRQRKAVRIFPYKSFLQAMVDCHQTFGNNERYVPRSVPNNAG
jgi:hypothetical protein